MKWEGWRETERLWAWARRAIANEEEERRGGAGGGELWAGTRQQEPGPCFRLLLPSASGT